MSDRLFAAVFCLSLIGGSTGVLAQDAEKPSEASSAPMDLLTPQQRDGISDRSSTDAASRGDGTDPSPAIAIAPPEGTRAGQRSTLKQRIGNALETLAGEADPTADTTFNSNAANDVAPLPPKLEKPVEQARAEPTVTDDWMIDVPDWRGDRAFTAAWSARRAALQDGHSGAKRAYARFAFAWGLISEARSRIDAFEDEIAVHALHLLAGDPDSAQRVLALASKAGGPDAALWRAVALPVAKPRKPEIPHSQAVIDGLNAYGVPLGRRLALRAMEIYARTGDSEAVRALSGWLEAIVLAPGEKAQLFRLRGDAYAAAGELPKAQEQWNRAAAFGDTADGVRATRNLIEAQLATGEIDRETAMAALEALAYRWRRDGMTAALHIRLAQWRWQAGDHLGAFTVLNHGLQRSDAASRERLIRLATSRLRQLIQTPDSEELPASDYVELLPNFAQLIQERHRASLGRTYIETLLALEHPEQAKAVASALGIAAPTPSGKDAPPAKQHQNAQPGQREAPAAYNTETPQSAAQVAAALSDSQRVTEAFRARLLAATEDVTAQPNDGGSAPSN